MNRLSFFVILCGILSVTWAVEQLFNTPPQYPVGYSAEKQERVIPLEADTSGIMEGKNVMEEKTAKIKNLELFVIMGGGVFFIMLYVFLKRKDHVAARKGYLSYDALESDYRTLQQNYKNQLEIMKEDEQRMREKETENGETEKQDKNNDKTV